MSNLTFVSITGPTLDKAGARVRRAHTTRTNFAQRRRRLVRDYADQKECAARSKSSQVEEDGLTANGDLVRDIRHPIAPYPGLEDRRLNRKDAFFINHCALDMDVSAYIVAHG